LKEEENTGVIYELLLKIKRGLSFSPILLLNRNEGIYFDVKPILHDYKQIIIHINTQLISLRLIINIPLVNSISIKRSHPSQLNNLGIPKASVISCFNVRNCII
jgi:hypothetical protein